MRHRTAEVPFTLSEVLEEEFRVVHDCRGRFFEFHWNNPAHIAERLKAYGLRLADSSQQENADLEILEGFSEFVRLGETERKNLQATLTRFTDRLNDLARDRTLIDRLLSDTRGPDTEEMRSFRKRCCDANARLLQCLVGERIRPRIEGATCTAYFDTNDLEHPEKLVADLERRFPSIGPLSCPKNTSNMRLRRKAVAVLNDLVKQQNMYVDVLASATPQEVPAVNRILLEACYGQYLHKSTPPYAGNDDALEEARLAMVYRHIHALRRTSSRNRSDGNSEKPSGPRVALCLSGGGIRSATYALGILQGLARKNVLKEFHYLSTVSGGGYVGSWLSAWIKRKGFAEVDSKLRNPPSSLLNPEPTPIRYLRRFSNYLTPKLGLLSADTWAAVGTVLRNMLLNWLVLLPLLMAFLALPYLIVTIVRLNSFPLSLFGFRLTSADLLLIVGCALATISLAYIHSYRPSLQGRTSENWKAWGNQNTYLFVSLLPLIAAAGLITTWWACIANDGRGPKVLSMYDRVPGLLFMLVAAGFM